MNVVAVRVAEVDLHHADLWHIGQLIGAVLILQPGEKGSHARRRKRKVLNL